MVNSQIKDFTKGNISKQLIVFAYPLFLSNLLQVLYNMVDMIVVGNVLGKIGISAVSVGGDVVHFLTFIAIGFSNAGQVIIAKYIGKEQRNKIGSFIATMSGFLFLCVAVSSVLGLLFLDEMLIVMNTPLEAMSGAADYSRISFFGLVFIYGYNIVSAILRGMGDSKHPFIFISVAAVLNLILDIIFVAYMNMGAGGAALATVISQGVSFISCTVFLWKNARQFELNVRAESFIHWDMAMLKDLLMLGIPMAIKTASIQISKLFVNAWINSYGVAVSAFSGIANKIASVSNLISTALHTAGATMVAQNIGAKQYTRVKDIIKWLTVITLTVAIFLSMLIYLYPIEIFSLFTTTKDADVLIIANGYIPIAILLFLGSALRAIMNALINGSGNYFMNFATAILDGLVIRIGLALLFGIIFNMKYYGFWLGDAIAGFTPFWLGIIFYFSGNWKKDK